MSAWHFAVRGWISAALLAALAVARHFSHRELRPAWLVFVALAAAYRVQAARYIGDHSNGGKMSEGLLAIAGPYALSRHPLYLSNMGAAVGLVFFANCLPGWGAALLLAAAFANYALLARAEERFLLRRGGESYARYLASTPRWPGFGRGRAPGSGSAGAAPGALRAALGRQAGNLAKSAAGVFLIWALGR